MNRLFILMLAALALPGCAEEWQKPGAPAKDFEMAYYNCLNSSRARFPARYREVIDETKYKSPLVLTRCESSNPSVICMPRKESPVFPSWTPSDEKEDARQRDFSACMTKNGWQSV